MSKILSKNPKTGEILREISVTEISDLQGIYERAERAQKMWSKISVKKRAAKLLQLRDVLARKSDALAEIIHQENGKPVFEALSAEIFPSIELLSFFAKIAPRKLRDQNIPIQNLFLRYRKSDLNFWPLGTVAVISPWNYPFFLAFGDIAVAILAGNSVIFKPSEYSSSVGLEIQKLFDEAGFPADILQTVCGDGTLGSGIIDQKPSKIFFTGSVRTGKAILKKAADQLIPTVLELGGKDAMIVLPDANLDHASSAALWGGYANSGQVCASIERLIVHESVVDEFREKLLAKLSRLSPETDLGVTSTPLQKNVYAEHLADAHAKGAEFYAGGMLSSDELRMIPTLVGGRKIEETQIYNDETFGPVIAMTTFRSVHEAIEKANRSPYGLLASVMTTNIALGEEVARELEVGTVLINEAVFSAALSETPWGGVKDTGMGRKHSEAGLYEFVNVRHINKPRANFLSFKSLWWFPYTKYQTEFFRAWIKLYRGSLLERLSNLPHFLWCAIKFIKNEPRL